MIGIGEASPAIPTTGTSDEALAALGRSDLRAFGELYRRYSKRILRYLAARVPDPATAEDLTTQVFIKAMKGADTYRHEGSYKAWLHQIARNTVANWQMEKARLHIPVASVPEGVPEDDSPTLTTLLKEESALIEDVVDTLPEAQREVVRLRYWKDLSIGEIADSTGRTQGSIRVLLHRSRRSLRARLHGKDLTAIVGATGAAASIAIYSIHRQRRHKT